VQYSTDSSYNKFLVVGQGNRAWFSHGGWLRLIDTEKGVVIGRWHFPGQIAGLTPEGTRVQVETEEQTGIEKQVLGRKLELDPSAPQIPYWPTNNLWLYRVPQREAKLLPPFWAPTKGKVTAEEAKKLVPELEEDVRRDPLTPWFRVALAKALRDLGDPRATAVFGQAIETPATDFTELLPISGYLDSIAENELARAAFERGYQDFWQRGNDPRVLWALIYILVLYQRQRGGGWGNPATPHGRESIERTYRVVPYGEAAELAWRVYADYLSAHGSTQEAQLWRARAADAEENGFASYFRSSGLAAVDPALLLALGSALAAVLYALVLYARYSPQSRLDLASHKQATGISRVAAIFNAHYWSRQERIAFFTIVLVGWFSIGLVGQYVAAILRRASLPISAVAGTYAGPITIDCFEHHLPPTPERDLLLAIAYQQDGQLEKAERFYRNLPQFAEGWNNLGVILKEAGKDQEARAAFEKALALDPKMAEAALNLGRPPSDFWTEQHQKYLPGRPMIAPPRGPEFDAALLGGSPARVYLKALAGPFSNVFANLGIFRKLLG
jgi:tetratricopeptide (TPR) repeat protein